ncbi:MAG: DNA topoisomerase I [Parcubacteria group bacterium 21-54-25]|nr:MAG: DNA topoisomerase I [Parcubacteria group bacterium 21-54-25]HQU07926.1 type I DNA topoisomerase [Candidatus Paceibacterota bacterium]
MSVDVAKKLLIVESPTKARTIGAYLGKEYEVLASVGHVRDLPKSNKDAVDVAHGFTPTYVVPAEKREIIERIKKAAAKASDIFLATDPDREGEAIAWHIAETTGLKKPKRVVFHEITKHAVEEALAHPRSIDQHLRHAQEARRVLDRIVGYDLSGLIWKKVRYGLSAGRVQSPALRILAEREREIKAFVPETYFIIDALFKAQGGEFPAHCTEEPKTADEAARIVRDGKKATWVVSAIAVRAEERTPRPPFTTSTLQQTASTRLGFSPSRTMRAAQKLYEAGHITYMRTDSVNLAKEAIAKMAQVVEHDFGKDFLRVRTYKTASKNAQEAHEAVRPTEPTRTQAGATPDEHRLYELIRTRALTSQMAAARIERTSVTTQANTDIPTFTTTGSRVLFPGWLALDTAARGEDVELPKLTEGDVLTLLSLAETEKQTEPPRRYTEAGLIKELEKRGIGRPSTYASIMKTIQDRGYVEKAQRSLVPTATGMVVSGWLEEHFSSYISDSFTAEMEDELDEISRGERSYQETLETFYQPFKKAIEAKDSLPKATSLGEGPSEFPCPVCGGLMEYKLGRGGVFLSCKRYPDCIGARQEDGSEIKPDEPIGTDPESGQPIFVRTGRYGPYVEMPLPEKDPLPKPVIEKSKKKIAKKTTKKTARKPKKKKIEAKRASIPPGKDPTTVTLEDALKYLSLPRELGTHPESGLPVTANTGRFGPYIAHNGEFRSLKGADDPYTITLDRSIALLAIPKPPPKGATLVRDIGHHPMTGRMLTLYKSKQGLFLKKGLRRVYLPESTNADTLTPTEAATFLA